MDQKCENTLVRGGASTRVSRTGSYGPSPYAYTTDHSIVDIISPLEVKLLPVAAKFFAFIISSLSVVKLFSGYYPTEKQVTNGQCFDVIVVGGGTAGCVIASRMSEVDDVKVLLIEAGGDPEVDTLIPSLFPFLSHSSKKEWDYYSEDDGYTAQGHKHKSQHYGVGKMLGGSSGNNYMIYMRGHKMDYEEWVEDGIKGWSWNTVLYYFKKSERMLSKQILNGRTRNLHSKRGYLGVSRQEWGKLTTKYLESFRENGRRVILDSNDINPLGYSQPCFTIDPPHRQNTALAFLGPIKKRKNLFVLKNTFVRKVIFDNNKRAVGVEVRRHGEIMRFCAKREVILSAGALNSPRILMSSGVGPKKHLEKYGIPVILDLPYVGRNLQDHPSVILTLTGKKSLLSILDNGKAIFNLNKFPTPVIMGLASLNKSKHAYPDYLTATFPFPAFTLMSTLTCSHVMRYEDYICEKIAQVGKIRETLFALVSLTRPESIGSVKLRSSDPEDIPIINSGYYKVKSDLDTHARCIQDYISILNTSYFRSVDATVVDYGIKQCKGLTFATHQYWKCYARNMVQTEWHVAGTCAMAPTGEGVTDSKFRVQGLKGIRVVDASSLPYVTSANIIAPVIMLAERASDLIKVENDWPVEEVEF